MSASKAGREGPGQPGTADLGHGLWKLPVAVVRNVPPTVNVYAVESGDRILLVDAGWDEESLRSLESGLDGLGASLADVEGIFLTHGHPDHAGLAAGLQQRTGCWVAAHPHERRWFAAGSDGPEPGWTDWLGAPPSAGEAMRERFGGNTVMRAPVITDLTDGQVLRSEGGRAITAVWTPGHSPGHLCLLDDSGALFTGDHVLSTMLPRLHQEMGSEEDLLARFLSSLGRTRALSARVLLPGHGENVTDSEARHGAVALHYRLRLDEVLAVLGPRNGDDPTTWDVAARLPGRRPWEERSLVARAMAATEAATFLCHLERLGRVDRRGRPPRWRPAAGCGAAPS
ncbi:MBL fold metallo-hydrolase [Streptomyces albipurpureus]|uniref:MBL fold metallo-hydrolase n=1 Tax=Streptomyces albipurpureus TaxID=2897419 RepID=A0ABT0UMA6_9ACTN|nr:MBL fold metallo-hydrolase [Streptomyces sp. CWNU-1]MCM2389643.1 MBL fold metallo-hydrolase [Streptomyces sp. CWNU-1]